MILFGPRGLGPMVTIERWEQLRRLNFGIRALTLPVSAENVAEQIQRYDPQQAAAVATRTRTDARLSDTVDRLVSIYEEVCSEFASMAGSAEADQVATARYLHHHAPALKAGLGQTHPMTASGLRSGDRERRMLDLLCPLSSSRSSPQKPLRNASRAGWIEPSASWDLYPFQDGHWTRWSRQAVKLFWRFAKLAVSELHSVTMTGQTSRALGERGTPGWASGFPPLSAMSAFASSRCSTAELWSISPPPPRPKCSARCRALRISCLS